MTLRDYALGGLVVVALGSAYGWYHNQLKAAEARGRVEETMTRLEQKTLEFEAYKRDASQRDSVLRLSIIHRDEAQDSLLDELTVAQRKSRNATARLDEVLADADLSDGELGAIEDAMYLLEAENITCSLVVKNCTEAGAERDTRIVGLLDAQAARDSLILEQEIAIERLQALQHPSSSLPWIVAGAASVFALAVIVFQ